MWFRYCLVNLMYTLKGIDVSKLGGAIMRLGGDGTEKDWYAYCGESHPRKLHLHDYTGRVIKRSESDLQHSRFPMPDTDRFMIARMLCN